MEKLNISVESSSDKRVSYPPCDGTRTLNPIPTSNNNNVQGGDESSVKTPWKELNELVVGVKTVDDGDGDSGVPGAVSGGDYSTVEEDNDHRSEGVQERKRKASLVRDPPTGNPTCPLCLREFSTWKGAFGHMRAHPDRDYRGFFQPPAFGSPSSIQNQPPSDDNVEGGDDRGKKSNAGGSASSPIQVQMFDLNEPGEEDGHHSAVVEPAEENIAEEGKNLGFDLNQLPPADEE